MKKVFLLLFLIGCTTQRPVPKYNYGDVVTFTPAPFLKNCAGEGVVDAFFISSLNNDVSYHITRVKCRYDKDTQVLLEISIDEKDIKEKQ